MDREENPAATDGSRAAWAFSLIGNDTCYHLSQRQVPQPTVSWELDVLASVASEVLGGIMPQANSTQDGPPAEPTEEQLRKAKQKAEDDARIDKLIKETERKIGGPVNEGGSLEENERRLNKFLVEIYKGDPKKDWPILTEAENYVESMRTMPFKLRHTSDEEEDEEEDERKWRKEVAKTIEGMKRGRDALRRLKRGLSEETEQPTSSAKAQAAKTTQTSANALQPRSSKGKGKQKATRTAVPTPAALPMPAAVPTVNSAEASTNASESQPKKKRRMENLDSSLGSKWDAHVDEFGHRPARSAKKQ
ncbi:hypothetical protein Hte_004085 [Hypoxylon texense]